MKRGFFDADGKCLMTIVGEGDPPPDLPYVTEAEVPDELGPNTAKLENGQVKEKARDLTPPPRRPGKKLLSDEVAELRAELEALKAKIK